MRAIVYLRREPWFDAEDQLRAADFDAVAVVEVPEGTENPLDFVYEKTQNVTHPWIFEDCVTTLLAGDVSKATKGGIRSLSVGDLVQLEWPSWKFYQVASFGFWPMRMLGDGILEHVVIEREK